MKSNLRSKQKAALTAQFFIRYAHVETALNVTSIPKKGVWEDFIPTSA